MFGNGGKKGAEVWESRVLISLMGACAVGKSQLIQSYISRKRFCRAYKPTLGVGFNTKVMVLDGHAIQQKIFDFSGTCIMDPNFYYQFLRYGNIPAGLILVYDITNQTSFLDVTGWYIQLKSRSSTEIPAVLVGMKADKEGSRKVDGKQVQDFLEQEGILCSTEVSVFDRVGCEFVFATITSLISQKYPIQKDKVMSISTKDCLPADKLK